MKGCRGDFQIGALAGAVLLLWATVFVVLGTYGDHRTWYVAWGYSLLLLGSLTPAIPGVGQMMCFAILQSMSRRRAWGMIGVFAAAFAVLYLMFTKAIAAALAGLFVVCGVLAVIAYLFRKKKLAQGKEKMEFVGTLGAAALYLCMVAVTFCFLFVSAVEVGKMNARSSVPLQMEISAGLQRVGGLLDVRGEIHVHSRLSGDSRGTLKEIAAAARKNGVEWIVLTDHISALPEEELPVEVDGVRFIYGSERNWNKQGSQFRAPVASSRPSRYYGHAELLKEWTPETWDAFELVNFHANALEKKWALVGRIFINPSVIYDEFDYVRPGNLQRWQELAVREGRPIPIFGGPDAHQNVRVFGTQADPYALMFHRISTHIWLASGVPTTEKSVLEAVKKGLTYIAFEAQGDPTGFQFWAENDQYQFFTGETVRAPKCLIVKPPPTNDCETRIYRDNQLMVKREPCTVSFCDLAVENPPPGFWRTEIWRFGKPWVISGQILVK